MTTHLLNTIYSMNAPTAEDDEDDIDIDDDDNNENSR